MKVIVSPQYRDRKDQIFHFIENFSNEGDLLGNGDRNTIKLFDLNGERINIKSFKVPNMVNKIAYRFFRKSKAERSFNYAQILGEKGIGTPTPIAYAEETTATQFLKSYYVSQQLKADLTFREINLEREGHEAILRAFTRFTFHLHEQEVEFLDHSPGNTLIKLNGGNYEFFLVDLNRMNFGKLNFTQRMMNFSRLTPNENMIRIMANEYASLIEKSENEVFEKMWFFTNQFQEKFRRKKALKKKFGL
ncbi:lipopolysaccharide kinase InaA family protein [Salegentibacter sediminis]|uniref:lipopolysaccharide kinase InaA family protein n=1 Tax=Salegentibacter sediminis TaxID=1930251 RepID=UPI0009BE166A|nr:lipopolysaccharide kinase InaA family protein [Salegentibacter sediminis]